MSTNVRVTADNMELSIVFNAIVEECCERNAENLISNIDVASDEAVEELKRTSPRGKSRKNPYWRGWTKTRQKIDRGLGGVLVVIHNKNKPTLTGLLEHGHDVVIGGPKMLGGRVVGKARAFPHINKAKEHAIERALRGA